MARYIDGDRLIRWVEDLDARGRFMTIQDIRFIVAELANSCWVNVKAKLPEVGKVVLALGERSATTGMFQGTMANRPDIWMWKNHTPKHVTHWMLLPEPPKEYDDDEGTV